LILSNSFLGLKSSKTLCSHLFHDLFGAGLMQLDLFVLASQFDLIRSQLKLIRGEVGSWLGFGLVARS